MAERGRGARSQIRTELSSDPDAMRKGEMLEASTADVSARCPSTAKKGRRGSCDDDADADAAARSQRYSIPSDDPERTMLPDTPAKTDLT